MPAIVYHPGYSMGFPGLSYLHPFDSYRALRVHREMRRRCGAKYEKLVQRPEGPISDNELLKIHSSQYIASVGKSATVASAVEISVIRYLPRFVVNWMLVKPMRLATAGAVLAGRVAMKEGAAINMAGGFHHAKPSRGEGFCLFSDIALIVRDLRDSGTLASNDGVVYIDLDAHQGNGVSYMFEDDPRVRLFDMYNARNYPNDRRAIKRLDADLPLLPGTGDAPYLDILQQELPGFLTRCQAERPVRLAIYNAGTDVILGDRVGQLGLSSDGVLKRDLFTIEELRKRAIPYVMLPSGGYTEHSANLIVNTLEKLVV
jgi:histone deacetylase 11